MTPVRRTLVLLTPLAVALAGCAQDGGHAAHALDTGLIPPGETRALTFAGPGPYALHCDPHPYMTHNVTVQEGGPRDAHVHIQDGNATSEYRFEPEALVVAPGAVVTYHNHGALAHTAGEMTPGMRH